MLHRLVRIVMLTIRVVMCYCSTTGVSGVRQAIGWNPIAEQLGHMQRSSHGTEPIVL